MLDALAQDPNFSKFASMFEKYKDQPANVSETVLYKPEYSWNYEVGTHLTLFDGKLQADLAAFYMDTRDQQISRFSENGLGRITVNAGKINRVIAFGTIFHTYGDIRIRRRKEVRYIMCLIRIIISFGKLGV